MRRIDKPQEGEFAPYTIIYIGLLPDDGRILTHLRQNARRTREVLAHLPEETLLFRYAEGKWTIKEILAHIIDDERIYTYRALRFARNDKTELPGFEQDEYAAYSGANQRTIRDLLAEFAAVRASTIALFQSLDADALLRSGTANGNVMSVRAAAYHIAGHELRHLNIIRERYLAVAPTTFSQ
ncbi:MAG TPA: DinB family protein [Acidobacteriota bacterium]|nr:DinB family protein [Acidobacteriota bacterium]